ncbi:hypothetical protein GGH94_004807 [Coemansia aciculifera]|uniref:Uncharacterized protein n=2 Tax=Coemansia TaxID=4863 RepID=A0A9W8LCY5_9FUNG|nr:hypothetical protein GGI19_000642 [Coemansia pectinata]KAJ2861585.1 hypothetical protein GGH94_004807 [Coemansia aciculifera]KAJ2871494.1 hypothetical protein GGH93_004771 [Coemansia aciculifera]KAJ2882153.1 hypothetical protein H4R27_003635 [Coemansia aciculifera]
MHMINTRLVLLVAAAALCVRAKTELGDLPRDRPATTKAAQFTGMMPDELSKWMDEQSRAEEASATLVEPKSESWARMVSAELESMEALRNAEFISDIVAALFSPSA